MGTSKCGFKWLILCYTENLSCVSFCKFWLYCRWTVQLLLCRQDTTYEGKFTCLCSILIRTISMRNYNLLIRNCIVVRPPFWKDRTTYRELRTMVAPSFCYGLIYLQLLTLLTTVYYSTDWRCVSREGSLRGSNPTWLVGVNLSTKMLVHAFVMCRLDNCNFLSYGLPKYFIHRLQLV